MTGWEWRVTDMAPPYWPRTWTRLPDARSLANVREFMERPGNPYGIELRKVADRYIFTFPNGYVPLHDAPAELTLAHPPTNPKEV